MLHGLAGSVFFLAVQGSVSGHETAIWEFPKIGDPNMVPKIVVSIL